MFVGAMVARYLGPEKLGILSLYFLIFSIIYPFATLGTDASIFKYFIQNTKASLLNVRSVLFVRVVATLVFIVVSIGLSSLLMDSLGLVVFSVIMASLVFDTSNLFNPYFMARGQSIYIASAGIISTWLSAGIRVLLIISSSSLVFFAVASLIQKFLNLAVSCFFYFSKKFTVESSESIVDTKMMLRSSFPLIFSTLTGMLMINTDQLAISYLLTPTDLGIYSSASKLIIASYAFLTIASNTIYGKLNQAFESQKEDMFIIRASSSYAKSYLLVAVMMIPPLVFSSEIIALLYGKDYFGAGDILYILSFSFFFVMINNNNNKLLMLKGMESLILQRALIGVSINIILNSILIPLWGINGAAVSTITSLAIIYFWPLLDARVRFLFKIQLKSLESILKFRFSEDEK